MPSLGFLKKKRTRDNDPSASNPTSPVTPTSSAPRSTSISKPFTSLLPRSSASTSSPVTTPTAQTFAQAHPTNAFSDPAATEAEQQQMNPVNVHSAYTTAGSMHDSQNLPSINNLINPQHNASGNHYPNPNHLQPYSVETRPQTVSPGSDAAHLQQQQLQAMSQPGMQQQPDQFQQRQPQQVQQPATQNGSQQQQQQPQQPANGSQLRVTKGKYSLGDFEILRTLGTGSFGRVHLVQSKHNQRFYAVKVLKKAQVVKMKQVEHTNDERRMLADVKHPFLITLWGTFQDIKNLYMVMDFVEGGELFSLLRKSGRFPNPVAKFYAAEVTLALEYLHSKNIIYRDLKPENLLLDRHGHLKITDFGFAKRVPDKTWTLCVDPIDPISPLLPAPLARIAPSQPYQLIQLTQLTQSPATTQDNQIMSHHVLLLGGHGKIAQFLTPLLLKRSWTVTSVIRNQEQIPTIESLGANLPGKLNVLVSSIEDVNSKDDALKVIHNVKPDFIAWSAGAGGKGAPERTFKVDRDAAIHFINAAAETPSIIRFLLISYLGSRREAAPWWPKAEWETFNQKVNFGVLANYYQAKIAADEVLYNVSKKSTLVGINLRPGTLSDAPAGKVQLGKTEHIAAGETVSREVVAQVADALLAAEGVKNSWIDLVDGDEEVEAAVQRVVRDGVDAAEGEPIHQG